MAWWGVRTCVRYTVVRAEYLVTVTQIMVYWTTYTCIHACRNFLSQNQTLTTPPLFFHPQTPHYPPFTPLPARYERTTTTYPPNPRQSEVKRVAFSPYGRALATTSGDGTVKLWDSRSFECYETLAGHEDHVFDAAWCNGGDQLVTASHDRKWRLWQSDRNVA